MNHRRNVRKSKSITHFVFVLFLALGIFGCSVEYSEDTPVFNSTTSENAPKNLLVHFLDVGQADSILVQVPNGVNMLIDAGNNEDTETIITYLHNLGIQQLDVVIGTHPHEDHIGSLDKVIEKFQVGQVIMPRVTTTTKTFEEVLEAIQEKGLKITEAKAGYVVNMSTKETHDMPIEVKILSPKSKHYEEMNDYSVVLRLDYGENSFLFTGDAEKEPEEEMVLSQENIQADVLKVGHHGSSSSTTYQFLKKVNPEVAVISVGKDNSYGHPHKSTLNRLQNLGVETYRTDKLGTIIAEADGSEITWSYTK